MGDLPSHLDVKSSGVELIRRFLASDGMSHGWWERMLLSHGHGFDWSPLPEDVPVMQPRCCYLNSFTLAQEQPERFTYYEGYAAMRGDWGGTSHAWCVDAQQRVIDATWPNVKGTPSGYLGLALPLDLVEPYAYFESHGTIDNLYRNRRKWMETELPRLLGVEPV